MQNNSSDISLCTLCQGHYSFQLPSSSHWPRQPCRLPLTLQCGHSCCYQCVMQRKEGQKFVSKVSCLVCGSINRIDLGMLKSNLPSFINCAQLGFIQLQEIELQLRAENVGFKDQGNLYTPTRDEGAKNVAADSSSSSRASVCTFEHDHLPLDYWCKEHKVAICSRCRLSDHLRHDVISAQEKHSMELQDWIKAKNGANQLLDRLQQAVKALDGKHCVVEADYKKSYKEARQKFVQFHGILQAREMEVQQKLHRAFLERSNPLKSVEKSLRDVMNDVNNELTAMQEPGAGRETVLRCAQLVDKLQDYLPALDSLSSALPEMSYEVVMESQLESIRILTEGPCMLSIKENGDPPLEWPGFESLFRELSCNKALPIQPRVQQPEKLLEEIPPPDIVSQAMNYEKGIVVEARISFSDSIDKFYVMMQPSGNSGSLATLQSIMDSQSKKRTTLTQVLPGQLFAYRPKDGMWSRVLVEDVNMRCDDVSIFHVDVGRRELVNLDRFHRHARHPLPAGIDRIPAQAVYCSIGSSARPLSLNMENRIVRLQVERVLAGQVGRLGHQEHTLLVTLLREDPPKSLSIAARNIPSPDWMMPDPAVEEQQQNPSPDLSDKPPKKKRLLNDKKTVASSFNGASNNNAPKKKMVVTPAAPSPIPESLLVSPLILPPLASQGQENRNRIGVILTHLNSPGHFYVRIISVPPALRQDFNPPKISFEDLSCELKSHYRSAPAIKVELVPGSICVVQLPESGEFRRCRILEDIHQIQLIDVGTILDGVEPSQLRPLEDRWSIEALPAMAFRCSVWGLRPAGHSTNWSKTSCDSMLNLTVKAKAHFARVYHVDGSILMVRFYYEFIQSGGPLGCDEIRTGCVNDNLMDEGLALKMPPSSCLVSVGMPEEWPACLTLPPDLEARPAWIDKFGVLHIHHIQGPYHHLERISRLLNWYYAGSRPDQMELAHWEVGQPCVARYSGDGEWCRGHVLAADDDKKLATILFVDFGNDEEKVPYKEMRRNLICFDYAIQAYRVRMAKYPGVSLPTDPELRILDDVLIKKDIRLSIKYPDDSDIPLATNVQFVSGSANLDDTFSLLRPETRPPIPIPTEDADEPEEVAVVACPPRSSTALQISSLHSDEGSDDDDSDDAFPVYNFGPSVKIRPEEGGDDVPAYRSLELKSKVSLPIRLMALDGLRGVIQPTRHSPVNEFSAVPAVWYEQADAFDRLHCELQETAPLFPEIQIVDHGCPCACYCTVKEKWYRGLVIGYADDNLGTIKVELVDVGRKCVLSGSRVKQLPMEYLALPRQSRTVKLPQSAKKKMEKLVDCETPLCGFFINGSAPVPEMCLTYRNREGRFVPLFD